MAAILVDYENGSGHHTLRGLNYLTPEDSLYIFYSKSCVKMRSEYWQQIQESRCELHMVKLLRKGKNGLDFYIAAQCGRLRETGQTHLAIISGDKGYDAVIDYFHQTIPRGMQIVRAESVERALSLLSEPSSTRHELIRARLDEIDMEAAFHIYEHKKSLQEAVNRLLLNTAYQEYADRICDYVLENEKQTPLVQYRDALHRFGLEQGAEIYQLTKAVVT